VVKVCRLSREFGFLPEKMFKEVRLVGKKIIVMASLMVATTLVGLFTIPYLFLKRRSV